MAWSVFTRSYTIALQRWSYVKLNQKTIKLLFRFCTVGVIGFLTNFLILKVAIDSFHMHKIPGEVVAAIVALNVTFFLHDNWTYKVLGGENSRKLPIYERYIAYVFSNSFGSIMTVVMFAGLSGYMSRLPALGLAALAAMVWNFFMNKVVIWRSSRKIEATEL